MKTEPYGLGYVGMVQVVRDALRYSDSRKELITLPAGCMVLDAVCEVTTAFDGGTPQITVGTSADTDALMVAGDITPGSVGVYRRATPVALRTTEDTQIVACFSASPAATQGEAHVLVQFVRLRP